MNGSFNNLYKNQLSPFGQKVLQVLVEQWHAEKTSFDSRLRLRHQQDFIQQCKVYRDSNKRKESFETFEPNGEQYSKKKCTLQFLEKETPIASTPFEPNVDHYSRKICTLKFLETKTPIASTPFELLQYKTTEKDEENIMCRDDLVNSAIDINADSYANKTNDGFELNTHPADQESIPIIDLESPRASPRTMNDDVSWGNMFDTELFHDNNNNESIENNMITIEDKLDVNLPEPQVDTFKKPERKLTKRKNTAELTEHKPKKERKLTVSNTKNIPRKENYSKAVKNWLDDVEKNSLLNIAPISTNEEGKGDKIVKEKTKKKVIQAQLANKEGKMKFDKPKNVTENKDKESSQVDDVKPVKEVGKEKKCKNKFVSPIKSQIPVKDVTYDVTMIDAHNVETNMNVLTEIANSDVYVVIVHRNGFCQLNCHYTEDTCIPEGIIINLNEKFFYFKTFDEIHTRTILTKVFQVNTVVCYEGKNILILLSHFDIKINLITICDIKIGGALLDPDNPPESFSDLQKLVSLTAEYTIATDCTLQKAAWYMTQLKDITSRLRDLLMENFLWNIFVNVEMRLLPIIADMEHRGVSVDLDKLKSMEQILVSKLKTVEMECHKVAGRAFQVNSPLQVRALLYDELKLDAKCNLRVRETLAKGAKSTSEATLRSLMSVHPLPKLILEYRHLHKAHATFLTGIAQHVKDGIVKPTWVQTAAATGRIASNNPNLQAIPKAPFSLIMFPESEEIENPVLNFRSVYTARSGHSLLAADFKHVECRVFAHAAADTALLDALRSDRDLFKVLAAKWLSKTEEEVSPADRERTKRIVYASLYGAGARKLMDILAAPYDQTLAIAASFNRTFPSLKSFGRSVVSQCERSGGRLSSLCGRARTFRDISNQDFAARSHAERQAVNFIVQGSAADLCKMAMILTEERLRVSAPPVRAHLVLQIHDELVWEVHDDDLQRAAATVKEVMENCGRRCGLPLPLPVALAAGRDWGQMEAVALLEQA